MSIMLGNDSVVHHPMNHLKKMINESGSDAHLDSGYASTASISYNLTDASVSTSMKKSLEPIAENYEATFNEASHVSVIETPTTRSMRQLSEFHIQTPQNDKRKQEMTPTKANYLYNVSRSGHKSSTKENRNSASPYKTTPNKTYGSSTNYRSFTQKINSASATKNRHIGLYDSTDIDDSFEMSVNEPSIECSPIAVHSKSLNSPAPTMHDSKRRTLQRHPSGIESSTPISRAIKRTHTQSVVKTHFNEDSVASTRHLLRKTQSFSPAKRVLREITNPCQTLERHDEQLEEDDAVATKEYNPARKMLAFASNQFQTLLTGNASVAQMPGQARPSGKAPTIAPTITPTKLARTTRQSTLQRQERFSFSPSPTIASPTRNDVAKQSIQEDAMRRPKKKMERSTSYNPTPPIESCIEKEQRKKFIHCTPPKSYRRKPLKRSAASAIGDDSTAGGDTSEPPAKRKLFYDGLEKLDIFGRLKNHTVVTDLILSMLSDEDLHASYQVCPSWSQIIQKRKLEYSRLLKYTRHLHRQKENANMRATSFEPEPSVATNVKRKPFEQRNLHYSLRSSPRRSPPVSPSKRKFHENQKVNADLQFLSFIHCLTILYFPKLGC